MSRFYGSLDGSARTQATRQGTVKSGLVGHVHGWNVGVQVMMDVDAEDRDHAHIYITGGSNGHSPDTFVLEVMEAPEGGFELVAIGAGLLNTLDELAEEE